MTKRGGRRLAAMILAGALCLALSGCGTKPQESSTQIFAMDTVMTLTLYGGQGETALPQATQLIYQLQNTLSSPQEGSFVHTLNHAGGAWVDIPDDGTLALLRDTLELCRATGGALDVTAYPAVQAWGFISKDYRVPGEAELEELAGRIDYSRVELDEPGLRVRLPQGMELDLGSVAKGWAGARLSDLVKELGVDSAILSLGGNVQAVGAKPDGSPWRVAIQDPDGTAPLAVVEVVDRAVVTSGGYQRFFEQDGQTYWHILDPDTAAPARSGLKSVTVIGPDGLVCDGLSTALFVMGLEEGAQFWRDHRSWEFEAVFVMEDGGVAITAGLEDAFSLAQGGGRREVTVLS